MAHIPFIPAHAEIRGRIFRAFDLWPLGPRFRDDERGTDVAI